MYSLTEHYWTAAQLEYVFQQANCLQQSALRNPEAPIIQLLLDTRSIQQAVSSVFFAIMGKNHDGHDFIEEAYRKGVRNFVVEKAWQYTWPDTNHWQVDSSVSALQALAAAHRARFCLPVIGITGSNGKTIVKEWLFECLAPDYSLVRSPRSFNSQIGVPLSVWQLQAHHELAIFEAGISQAGEMQQLAHIIRPTIGVFTHLGAAHDQGFSSRKHKLQEKLKLFAEVEQLIYPYALMLHYPEVEDILPKHIRRLRWGTEPQAEVVYKILQKDLYGHQLHINYAGQSHRLYIPFGDEASLENSLSVVTTLLGLGYRLPLIAERIARLRPLVMRMELKQGLHNNTLIDDSYSNDLESLAIALSVLQQHARQQRKIAILSDVVESGLPAHQIAMRVAQLLAAAGVDGLIAVGQQLKQYAALFTHITEQHFFDTTEALLGSSLLDHIRDAFVLIKGARHLGFERLVQRLERHHHRTSLEISIDKLIHNYYSIRRRLHPDTKIMVMVKALAYGSGAEDVARLLHFMRADYLAVAYTDEGVQLRRQGVDLPIMVMNPDVQDYESLLTYRLEPELYSFATLEHFLSFARRKALRNYPIHLKIDTGMRRLGFELAEVTRLIEQLTCQHHLMVRSVFTHLAAAENPVHDTFTACQLRSFAEVCQALQQGLKYSFLRHVLNSAGVLRFPEAQYDMVRLGIALYGIDPSGQGAVELELALRWQSAISQIKQLNTGESVGYGRRFVAPYPMRIATVAVGYADGFRRQLSNGVGGVYIHGCYAPVVGSVCMDMCMVDVSHVPQAREGDRVVLFENSRQLKQIADQLQTIPYEVLTSIGNRVRRVFYTES